MLAHIHPILDKGFCQLLLGVSFEALCVPNALFDMDFIQRSYSEFSFLTAKWFEFALLHCKDIQ
jgi:hypothetical protein